MTDWTPEEDEAFNEVEKHSNLGKQILREIKPREWVGLTRDEILEARWHNKSSYKFARVVEAILKEKNA